MTLPGFLSWLCSDHKSECVKCTLGMVGWSTTGFKNLKKISISLCAVIKLSSTRGQPQSLHQCRYASSSQGRLGLLAGQESMIKATRILIWGWAQNWDNKRKVLGVRGNLVGDAGFLQEIKTEESAYWSLGYKAGIFIIFFFILAGNEEKAGSGAGCGEEIHSIILKVKTTRMKRKAITTAMLATLKSLSISS